MTNSNKNQDLSENENEALSTSTQNAKEKSFHAMQLKKRHRTMDFGCGAGYDLDRLSDLVDIDGEVWGVDQDPIMIKNAILNNSKSNVRFLKSSANKLNFPKDYFHSVRAENVLKFLDFPKETLNELIRVTKPEGTIVSLDMDWETLSINSDHPSIEEEVKIAAATHMSQKMMKKGQIYEIFQKSELEHTKIETVPFYTDSIDVFNQIFFKSFTRLNDEMQIIAHQDMQIFIKELYKKANTGEFFATISQILITAQKPALRHPSYSTFESEEPN